MKNHLLSPILCSLLVLTMSAASLAQAADSKEQPVKIYLLVGQSNMQGKGAIEGEGTNSLRHMVDNDPKKEFQSLVNKDGEWVEHDDVWIHYDLHPFRELRYGKLKPGYGASSGQIGPEFGFGQVMGDASKEKILLIKAAWGGKSLGHNFLPPSVGKYPKPVEADDPGYFYHRILDLVREVTENVETFFPDYQGQGVELAGLGWHQGWNDQYGDLDLVYEKNLVAFINDIRSAEHGLGLPDLPIVIASSGMISNDSKVVQGQLAVGDTAKYPQFSGNVAVVNTDQPYGPDKMEFKYYTKGSPDKVGYHWNNHANSYFNIGRAMAAEMQKLNKPKLPARLISHGSDEGVQLLWQIGTEKPESIDILRNGKSIGAKLSSTQTTYIDTAAEPGPNTYEVVLKMPSGEQKLSAACDTSATDLYAFRSLDGVQLSWKARGKYAGFQLLRDGKVVADDIAGDQRSYLDKSAPDKGKVNYTLKPTTGKSTPVTLAFNIGPADPGTALVYEPFNYPANAGEPLSILGKGGATGTKGEYFYLADNKQERAPAVIGGGVSYGKLPTTGNRAASHRWSPGCAIALDDSLKKAGLLEDGATLWISYVFYVKTEFEHRSGGGTVALMTEDQQQGVGFRTHNEYQTAVILDGKLNGVRITSAPKERPTLVVGKVVWGKDGEDDTFVPYMVRPDLVMPEKPGRAAKPFQIDQQKLSHLVLSGEGQYDEIRVGPTYESVIGGGTK